MDRVFSERGFDPHSTTILNCFKFVDAQTLKFSLGYSALNTARSALSAVVVCENSRESVGTHPDICTYLRGVFNEESPTPRYNRIWNPKLVLDFLWSNGFVSSYTPFSQETHIKIKHIISTGVWAPVRDVMSAEYVRHD